MRKQVDFAVRVFPLGNGGNGTLTGEQVAEIVRDYQKKGFEVFNISAFQVTGLSISYHIAFIKYEEVTDAVRSAK